MTEATLTAAFIFGLMGAGHCLGMCGGIIGSLSMATEKGPRVATKISAYQIGRITSYSLIGLLAGWLGQQGQSLTAWPVLKILSASLLILMGLYISQIWMLLRVLENFGQHLWSRISPLSKHLLPVKNTRQALFLGALWGWLPCGLVYTSLSYAITTGAPIKSALFMLCFGLGTLPATLLAGAAGVSLKRGLNLKAVRFVIAFMFISYGIYLFYDLIYTSSAHAHH